MLVFNNSKFHKQSPEYNLQELNTKNICGKNKKPPGIQENSIKQNSNPPSYIKKKMLQQNKIPE